LSGIHWNPESGINLDNDYSQSVWEDYTKKNLHAKQLQAGWEFYYDIQPIICSKGKGENVYHPSMQQNTTPHSILSINSSSDSSSHSTTSPANPFPVENVPPPSKPPSPSPSSLAPQTGADGPSPSPSISSRGPMSFTPSLASSAGSSSSRQSKRPHTSTSQAINKLSKHFSTFNTTFMLATKHKIQQDKQHLASNPSCAEIQKKARDLIQQDNKEFLGVGGMLAMLNLIEKDPCVVLAETYVGIEDITLRRSWLEMKLAEVGIHTLPAESLPELLS
jgi:hypothetical protein